MKMSEKRKEAIMAIKFVLNIPYDERNFPGIKAYWERMKKRGITKEAFILEVTKYISGKKMKQLYFFLKEDKTLHSFIHFAKNNKKYPGDVLLEEAIDYLNNDDHKQLQKYLSNE